MIVKKKNGVVKRFSNGRCWDDKCFHCGAETKILASDDAELQQYAEKHSTMEAAIYYCPKCGARYLETELNDYDTIKLEEIEIDPSRPNPTPPMRYFIVDDKTYERYTKDVQKAQSQGLRLSLPVLKLVAEEVYRRECWSKDLGDPGHLGPFGKPCRRVFYCKGECGNEGRILNEGGCFCKTCITKELARNPNFLSPEERCNSVFDEPTRIRLERSKVLTIDPNVLAEK